MNQIKNLSFIKNLSLIAVIAVSSSIANAQCKDGVCRIPSLPSSSEYSRSTLSNSLFRSPLFSNSSSFTSYKNVKPASACVDGRCQLGNHQRSDCDGANCPSHQQTDNYRPGDNLTRRPNTFDRHPPVGGYEAGGLQAPRPVSQPYQAANYSPNISWITSYEQGLEESRRTGRPVLAKVSAEWCDYCQRMKRDTYSDQGIVRSINSTFIPVALDADQNRRLVQQMRVRTLPAIVIITPDLKIVDRIEGYKTVRQLNASLLRHTQRAELETDIKVATR